MTRPGVAPTACPRNTRAHATPTRRQPRQRPPRLPARTASTPALTAAPQLPAGSRAAWRVTHARQQGWDGARGVSPAAPFECRWRFGTRKSLRLPNCRTRVILSLTCPTHTHTHKCDLDQARSTRHIFRLLACGASRRGTVIAVTAAMLTREQLLQFLAPDETAADFFRRQATETVPTGLPCIDAHIKLRPGHILELAGPTGCGKTELLAQVRRGRGCTSAAPLWARRSAAPVVCVASCARRMGSSVLHHWRQRPSPPNPSPRPPPDVAAAARSS